MSWKNFCPASAQTTTRQLASKFSLNSFGEQPESLGRDLANMVGDSLIQSLLGVSLGVLSSWNTTPFLTFLGVSLCCVSQYAIQDDSLSIPVHKTAKPFQRTRTAMFPLYIALWSQDHSGAPMIVHGHISTMKVFLSYSLKSE